MPIKTFRGLMADGAQDTIVLHTNDGSMGYKIVKFQLFPSEPGEHYNEGTVKIYKVSPSNIDNTVDFAATDKPVSAELLTKMQWQQLPIVKGAIVPGVHINKVSATLVLSGSVLANIYQGKIKFWDDENIKKLN